MTQAACAGGLEIIFVQNAIYYALSQHNPITILFAANTLEKSKKSEETTQSTLRLGAVSN